MVGCWNWSIDVGDYRPERVLIINTMLFMIVPSSTYENNPLTLEHSSSILSIHFLLLSTPQMWAMWTNFGPLFQLVQQWMSHGPTIIVSGQLVGAPQMLKDKSCSTSAFPIDWTVVYVRYSHRAYYFGTDFVLSQNITASLKIFHF